MIFSKLFWKDALERAIKTVAQVLLSGFSLDASSMFTIEALVIIKLALGSGILSILFSVVSSRVGDDHDSASLFK